MNNLGFREPQTKCPVRSYVSHCPCSEARLSDWGTFLKTSTFFKNAETLTLHAYRAVSNYSYKQHIIMHSPIQLILISDKVKPRFPGIPENKHRAVSLPLQDYLIFRAVDSFTASEKYRVIETP